MDGFNHRGHPRRSMWSAVYAAATIMGVLYLADVAESRSLAGATDGLAAYTWQWSLFLGGVAGLVGNLMPRRYYRHALTIEASGALITGVMAAIYVGVIAFAPATNNIPYATVAWMSAVIVALVGRFFEAFHQRRKALDYEAATRTIAAHNNGG